MTTGMHVIETKNVETNSLHIDLMIPTQPIASQTSTRTLGMGVARNTQMRTVAPRWGRRGPPPRRVVLTVGLMQMRY
jgi:hypothetical protein